MGKYEEALERARQGKPIDEVFPELKESEDERIRKILINIVKGAYCKYGIKCGGDEFGEEKILAYLEKKKEQKPADEQDYAGLNDLERAIHRGFLVAGVENVPVTIIKETAQECLAQTKPSEWSREDEMMFTFVVDTLVLTNGAAQMKIDWLKRLKDRVLIQSKSAEWSDEDVKMIGIAISFVQVASCNSILGVDKLDVIAWLKALRSGILNGNSHRKPSEEQINALKEIDVNS